MAIPIVYNIRSVKARWTSSIVAVLGIAGTVGVFVAMLSLARGFRATLVASGSPDNAIVMRAGATSEMMSGIRLEDVKILQDAPGSLAVPRFLLLRLKWWWWRLFRFAKPEPTPTFRCEASRAMS